LPNLGQTSHLGKNNNLGWDKIIRSLQRK